MGHAMNRAPKFVIAVPLVGLAVAVYAYGGPPWKVQRLAGFMLMIAGLIPWAIARVQLGNSFAVMPQARQLVTGGLYSRIRNPRYIFSAFLIAGLFLFLGNPNLLLILLVIIPLQFLRARAEARVLEEHFGNEYRQYQARTCF
jgi:protein-S-isoprenylcysteine O-methyltransferase Ste14